MFLQTLPQTETLCHQNSSVTKSIPLKTSKQCGMAAHILVLLTNHTMLYFHSNTTCNVCAHLTMQHHEHTLTTSLPLHNKPFVILNHPCSTQCQPQHIIQISITTHTTASNTAPQNTTHCLTLQINCNSHYCHTHVASL